MRLNTTVTFFFFSFFFLLFTFLEKSLCPPPPPPLIGAELLFDKTKTCDNEVCYDICLKIHWRFSVGTLKKILICTINMLIGPVGWYLLFLLTTQSRSVINSYVLENSCAVLSSCVIYSIYMHWCFVIRSNYLYNPYQHPGKSSSPVFPEEPPGLVQESAITSQLSTR